MKARSYGINAQRSCEVWLDWMLDVTAEAVRVSRGLVLWVVGGSTKDWCYQPGPEGLLYRWWSEGVGSGVYLDGVELPRRRPVDCAIWRPVIWRKVGIAGSGGRQWFRSDTEYVMAFLGKAGPIPWADPTATGKPPKHRPGGKMSHRKRNGDRVNCPSNSDILIEAIEIYGYATETDPAQVLRDLQDSINQETTAQWVSGVASRLRDQELLQSKMPRRSESQEHERVSRERQREGSCQEDHRQEILRNMRQHETSARPSCRRESSEQRPGEQEGLVPRLSHSIAREGVASLSRLWQEESLVGPLREALLQVKKTWQSDVSEGEPVFFPGSKRIRILDSSSTTKAMRQPNGRKEMQGYIPPKLANPGNLLEVKVGGGLMGSKHAHENEAPYPVGVPEFFIKSCCPPGGVVLDPFSGSGTTSDAAERNGRHSIGMDLRLNQCELAYRRMADPPPVVKAKKSRPSKTRPRSVPPLAAQMHISFPEAS